MKKIVIIWLCIFTIWIITMEVRVRSNIERLYPEGNKQELVTACNIKKYIEPKYNGYFIDKDIIKCNLVAEEKSKVYVTYIDKYGDWVKKWLPRKKFYTYYTLEELSEVVNKTRRRK